jgi:glycosyltransferase involved in cell wall biosynthesis
MTSMPFSLLSVVIPVKDEATSLPILHEELSSVLSKQKKPYEIIYIDDGSTDHSFRVIESLKKKDSHVRMLRFHANFGKSLALAAGFQNAKGEVIVTLDADLQDDPHDIPRLMAKLAQGYDAVCGWRVNRADTPVKQISSALFNAGTALMTGVRLHDMNCGLKAIRRTAARDLHLHGELHRFIPVLIAKRKFTITEVPVHNRKRRFGVSKYGLERSWRGIIDLLTAIFLTDYAGKPGHFFGKIGILFFLTGFMFDAYVAYLKITTGTTQDRIPLLLGGILLMVLGVQLLSTGLIAEMILHNSPDKQSPYIID